MFKVLTVLFLSILIVALLTTIAPAPADATTRSMRWFHPNTDCCSSTIFNPKSDYAQVMRQVHVWGFFISDVMSNKGGLLDRGLVMLQKNGAKISVEGGWLGFGGCVPGQNGAVVARRELAWMQPIYDRGGHVDYLQMDDPILRVIAGAPAPYGTCGFDQAQAVQDVLLYMQTIHATHPEIQIGTTVGYQLWPAFGIPSYSGSTVLPPYNKLFSTLVSTLKAGGEHLAFLHVDFPYEYAIDLVPSAYSNYKKVDWVGRIVKLERLAESKGVPFGLIYNSNLSTTNRLYYNRTLRYLTLYKKRGTSPRDYVLESWYDHPNALAPIDQQYTGLFLADKVFRNARNSCNGVPGYVC